MPPIIIVKIAGPDLDELMNNCVPQKFSEDQEKFCRLRRDAFSGEYKYSTETESNIRFRHSQNHSYYLAKCDDEPECLFNVALAELAGESDKKLTTANLSFGRITNLPTHSGWQYLKAFTQDIMIPQGPFMIISRFKGKGGSGAFQDLEFWQEHIVPKYEYAFVYNESTGYITNDDGQRLSLERILKPRSMERKEW